MIDPISLEKKACLAMLQKLTHRLNLVRSWTSSGKAFNELNAALKKIGYMIDDMESGC